jgi:adenosylcobinamide-GDP ribazoletransferase
MRQLRAALGFLTPLPVGDSVPGAATLPWLPVVGALLGVVLALVWWGAGSVFPPLVAGVLVVGADVVLTGALHLDGLADTADGLLAHKGVDREQRLAIMKAPDVGAFGVAAVVVVLALRVAVFASMDVDGWLVVAFWMMARGLMAQVLLSEEPYVGGGLATVFRSEPRSSPMAWTRLVTYALAGGGPLLLLLIDTTQAVGRAVAWLCAYLAAVAVVTVARRRLGGITGDVLGAMGMVVETVGLVVASARW